MTFPRSIPHLHLRSFKFAPFAVFALFLFTNLTGVFFSHAFAPNAQASTEIEALPSDLPSSGNTDTDWMIFRAAERQGLDPRFVHAVIWQESKYKPRALSHAGAQGLMQLMPATAKRFGCKDANDPEENLEAGTKYLSWLLKRFDGNIALALAGYNAGEGAVDKYDGIPPYNETQNYVRKITARYGKTFHPVPVPSAAKLALNMIRQGSQAEAAATE